MSDTLLAELEALLRDERDLLRRGELDALAPVAEQKQALFERLAETPRIAPARLEAVKGAAEHNRALLASAARGLKIVARRLAEIRSANGPLNTYSQSGQRQTLGNARGALERRA